MERGAIVRVTYTEVGFPQLEKTVQGRLVASTTKREERLHLEVGAEKRPLVVHRKRVKHVELIELGRVARQRAVQALRDQATDMPASEAQRQLRRAATLLAGKHATGAVDALRAALRAAPELERRRRVREAMSAWPRLGEALVS